MLKRKNGEGHLTRVGYIRKRYNSKPIMEHRKIWMDKYGLIPIGHDIHHINKNKSDNRIENLELCISYHPPSQRVEDQLSWAREIIKRYGGS